MKALRLVFLACVFALAGCATMTKDITKQIDLVRDSFNSLLPSDFKGPVDLSVIDMYVTARIRATNVHKMPDSKEWSWDSVSYDGKLTIPWFAGLTYTREVHFAIGSPGGVPVAELPSPVVGTVTAERETTLHVPGVVKTTVTTSPR